MVKIPEIKLSNGYKIPQIGLGLWQVKDENSFKEMFNDAIKIGYRHFDTAQAYNNEKFLGDYWNRSGIKRNEFFFTTKIAVQNFTTKKIKSTFEESLNNLQTEYVDLLLLHFPVPVLRKKAWHNLEDLLVAKKVKSIGVSNYTTKHLEQLSSYAKVMPVVNQVELHIFLRQPELIDYCNDNNISIEAYSPLAHSKFMDDSFIKSLAKKYHKSYAQIMLRWCIDSNLVVLPKTTHKNRLIENFNIFDFKLDKLDIDKINKLKDGQRTCWDPTYIP